MLLLSMYLPTDVFQQKEQSKKKAMAFACDFDIQLTATKRDTATPRALFPPRISILKQRSKYRKLLLSTTSTTTSSSRESKLFSKLWCRKRRRKLPIIINDGSAPQLLLKLKFLQYKRFIHQFHRAANAKIFSTSDESIEEGKSTRDFVPSDRIWNTASQQNPSSSPISANRLRSRSTWIDRQ
jgi:hypothetical protein